MLPCDGCHPALATVAFSCIFQSLCSFPSLAFSCDGKALQSRFSGSMLIRRGICLMDSESKQIIERLMQENLALKALLHKHEIPFDEADTSQIEGKSYVNPVNLETNLISTDTSSMVALPIEPEKRPQTSLDSKSPLVSQEALSSNRVLSAEERLAIFASLFKGRNMYAKRWESAKTGKKGYSPACRNEFVDGVCNKKKTNCADCKHRDLLPLTKEVLKQHLLGNITIGVYPLLDDNTCYFLACDFDKESWVDDARGYVATCRELGIPAYTEVSRSGNGAHVWIFFSEAVLAKEARELGFRIISLTCDRIRQLSLTSYDRFFPNQDTLPSGGFGNLIALPLQKVPRSKEYSVFVDEQGQAYTDQWELLNNVGKMDTEQIQTVLEKTRGEESLLELPSEEESLTSSEKSKPWETKRGDDQKLTCPLPAQLTLVIANMIFIEKNKLPQQLLNRLIRLAAFQNPEFYKAQAMRFSVWDKPRIIGCAENYGEYIALPRGCLEAVQRLLELNKIDCIVDDKRGFGEPIQVSFSGTLRPEQEEALNAMLSFDTGILHAPTASGKTVIAAALIAKRKVSTLILVHRSELKKQWEQRLKTFLSPIEGILGKKGKLSYKVDVLLFQSLGKKEDRVEILDRYGMVVVDECHHLGAFSFELLLKQVKAKYVVGLTATPIRRDGKHPIVTMQLGPIRHVVKRSSVQEMNMVVFTKTIKKVSIPDGLPIQEVFKRLALDKGRNRMIAEDVKEAYSEGRNILVLSQRCDHLLVLAQELEMINQECFVLHGRMGLKKRRQVMVEFDEKEEPKVLLSTGSLIGEGFDKPVLDTLFLALPISWKGTLSQYAGRLNREYPGKIEVRVYDYVDGENKQLLNMFKRRQVGYRALGYREKEGWFG